MNIELAILIGALSLSMSIIVSGWIIRAAIDSLQQGEILNMPSNEQDFISDFVHPGVHPIDNSLIPTRDDVRRRKSSCA